MKRRGFIQAIGVGLVSPLLPSELLASDVEIIKRSKFIYLPDDVRLGEMVRARCNQTFFPSNNEGFVLFKPYQEYTVLGIHSDGLHLYVKPAQEFRHYA